MYFGKRGCNYALFEVSAWKAGGIQGCAAFLTFPGPGVCCDCLENSGRGPKIIRNVRDRSGEFEKKIDAAAENFKKSPGHELRIPENLRIGC